MNPIRLLTFTAAVWLTLALSANQLRSQDQSSPPATTPNLANDRLLREITDLEAELIDPQTPREQQHLIHKKLARSYNRLQDYEKAIVHLEDSIKLQKTPPVQEFQALGQLLFEHNKDKEAVKLLRDGQKLYPDSLDLSFLLTFPLKRQEKWKAAIEEYENIKRISDEQTPNGLTDQFYFQYGGAVERAGDIDKAAQLFQKSLEIMPPGRERNALRSLVLNYLGYMWLENDMNIEVAGQLVKKAAKLDPDSGAIADSVGWYYFKTERYIEAMKELVRAESLMEDQDPVVMDHIAQTFFKIGNKEEAVAYMEKAIKLDPDNEKFQNRLKLYQAGN